VPKELPEKDIFKIRKRLRLYGKPASKIQISKEVSRLLLGDSKRFIDPLNITEVAQKLGFHSRTTIYFYVELAKKQGFIQLDDSGKPMIPDKPAFSTWKQYNEIYSILSDPMLKVWFDKQKLKKNGKLKILRQMVTMLENICNTCRITPTELIESKESAEKFKEAYLSAYQEGKNWSRKQSKKRASLEGLNLRASYAIASFAGVHGISWEKGTSAMSRKIVGHGNYSDVRLTNEEYTKANVWIKENYGLDSDLFRWFWFGIESCGRKEAMKNARLEWTIHKSKTGKTTFIMEIIETKTIHIKNGRWTKYIRNSELQESLMRLKERGGTRIYENTEMNGKFDNYIYDMLKKLYTHLGKEESHNGYYFKHPSHVLRHLGAHFHLAKGNYMNHSLVAKIGGWNIVDELIKSYGEIPPEQILDELDKY